MSKLEDQLNAIFGDKEAVFKKMDDKLIDDLKPAIGFDPSYVSHQIENLFESMGLTYAQRGVVMSDLFARSSKASEIAAVVNLRTLENNIAAMLVRAAHEADLDYEPLVEVSCNNIVEAAHSADAMLP